MVAFVLLAGSRRKLEGLLRGSRDEDVPLRQPIRYRNRGLAVQITDRHGGEFAVRSSLGFASP